MYTQEVTESSTIKQPHTRTHTHTDSHTALSPITRAGCLMHGRHGRPDTRYMYVIIGMPPIPSPRTPDLILLRFRIISRGSTDRTRARGGRPVARAQFRASELSHISFTSVHQVWHQFVLPWLLRRALLLPRAVLLVQVAVLLRVVQIVVIMHACHDGSHGHCALSGRCGARSDPPCSLSFSLSLARSRALSLGGEEGTHTLLSGYRSGHRSKKNLLR